MNFLKDKHSKCLCYATKLTGRPFLHQLQRDPTRVERRLPPNTPSADAGVVGPHIRQLAFISKCKKEEGSLQHESGDRRLEVECLLRMQTDYNRTVAI
ncbi:hypothetical protein Y032_0109g88 [Ancylostoma ceylanicum]|uniref:Uncharacterized protein n=1 Tax=Ancylostoma ceylanicum TaxID=53326 RepID=A0A016TF07_9BILA|nr:hypothetical protein Y032_0109g88 [Ancylostoma ceylanicum]